MEEPTEEKLTTIQIYVTLYLKYPALYCTPVQYFNVISSAILHTLTHINLKLQLGNGRIIFKKNFIVVLTNSF